ncbi:MAG: Rrf2 family transcriptional regulator [Flavobacteriales bacterium]|jgi:Rrf2 family protein|nr:Rrf2 family transcriptional regulator [Flavobacteriales bacterium]
MFSKACEYAIRATLRIAELTAADERATVKGVAASIGAPEAFTAKVLQQLVRDGHLGSMKGPGGGFVLTEARAKRLKLADIVKSIDGDAVYTRCALGLLRCSDKRACPIHDQFKEVRDRLRGLFEGTSIFDVSMGLGLEVGAFLLKG